MYGYVGISNIFGEKGQLTSSRALVIIIKLTMDPIIFQLLETTKSMQFRYDELSELLGAPEITADARYFLKLSAERNALEEAVSTRVMLAQTVQEQQYLENLAKTPGDPELERLLQEELALHLQKAGRLARELSGLLLPKSASGAALLEISAAEGGNRAGKFIADLFGMYETYAASNGWLFEPAAIKRTEGKCFKSAAARIAGSGAFAQLKGESGLHRAGGKEILPKGTVAAWVMIFPELEKKELELKEEELRIDLFHSGGAGGQNVNKVESAVRVTHLPTKTVAVCQDERSQLMNKERAILRLKEKLYEIEEQKIAAVYGELRREFRAQKDGGGAVRSYDYDEKTVTDNRSGIKRGMEDVFGARPELLLNAVRLANARAEESR